MLNSMISETPAWMMVFARMGGLIGMNPMFARTNVPALVRAGLILLLTSLIAPGMEVTGMEIDGSLALAEGMMKELFVGVACGFVYYVFYYMLFMVGDLMDTQFGLGMAKVFDPGTNIQTSVSGNWLNIIFTLYLFATDSHLLLIRIFATSFEIVPLGGVLITQNAANFFIELFISVFSMALRLVLPFMAAEFVMEICMGLLMKLIPQIHVFVVNIQMRVLLGVLMLFLFASPIGAFVDNYMRIMLENIQNAFTVLTAP